MWRGLYTAAAGMIQETQRTDVISNNLANVNTNGFKRDVAISEEFEPMLIRRINDKDMRNDVTSFTQLCILLKTLSVFLNSMWLVASIFENLFSFRIDEILSILPTSKIKRNNVVKQVNCLFHISFSFLCHHLKIFSCNAIDTSFLKSS